MAALKKKDDDMRAMEDRYKMYLEKARNVITHSYIQLITIYSLMQRNARFYSGVFFPSFLLYGCTESCPVVSDDIQFSLVLICTEHLISVIKELRNKQHQHAHSHLGKIQCSMFLLSGSKSTRTRGEHAKRRIDSIPSSGSSMEL